LQALASEIDGQDWVLVHDAARPGLTVQLLDRLLDALQDDEVGGLLAIPLADTLKRAVNAQRVACTESRDHLWQAQTPQMFRYGLLKQALIQSGGAPTDEAQAVEALGLQPKLVVGELRNLKITYPQDLAIAEAILRADVQSEPLKKASL
jgi:2-C-methyl-D-erythritol 4-phosphate cytidylyltransferase